MIKKISNHSIGKSTLTNLTTFKLIKYRDEIASVRTKSTANKYITLISVALKTAINEWGIYLPKNPAYHVPRLEEKKKITRILMNGEYDRLLTYASSSKLYFLKAMIVAA